MRHSNHADRGHRRLPTVAAGLLALILAACGSSNVSPPPSTVAAPSPTPDPHLAEPVTADQIYNVLYAAKIGPQCPNANLGNGNPRIVKQINCTVGGWPLRIIQYKTAALLADSLAWTAGGKPEGDEAPYNWAALNILIQFGPISARAPATPEAARQTAAASLFAVLDPLLWPIAQHSVLAIQGRTPEPSPTPTATAAPTKTPSRAPTKTPRPSKAP
jgi:hypothetical protein